MQLDLVLNVLYGQPFGATSRCYYRRYAMDKIGATITHSCKEKFRQIISHGKMAKWQQQKKQINNRWTRARNREILLHLALQTLHSNIYIIITIYWITRKDAHTHAHKQTHGTFIIINNLLFAYKRLKSII